MNTGGGEVTATWGLAAKISEHGNVKILVDGAAISSGCNLLMYAKEVECLDVSTFLFHRAAWEGYGSDTPEAKAFVEKANGDLRKKMEAKVDSAKLKTLKGYSIAELFESPERINLFLTASDMKQLGIVSKINTLEPSDVKAFNDRMKLVAEWSPEMLTKIAANSNPQTSTTMTLAELKEKHPAIYAEAIALGKTEGMEAERDRVGAAMVFASLDIKGVTEIIKSGKPMSATQMAEFSLKAASPAGMAALKAGNAAEVKTEAVADVPADAAKKEVSDFEKDVRASLGLDNTKVSEGKGVALAQIK
jgi:ATP-dependent protease ClpP protease subunit